MIDEKKLPEIPTRVFLRKTFSILVLYWKGEEKVFAWVATISLVLLALSGVATALAFNEWYKHFYNAIQELNGDRFYYLVWVFFGVVSFSVLRSVLISYLVNFLALKWRKWLTNYYIDLWALQTNMPSKVAKLVDNPDQRIAEDINKFTYESVDLTCGLIYTLASVVSFSVVLIGISGEANLFGYNIPYYMFWAAIFYAVIGTYISQKIGFVLVSLSNKQQKSEADFRFDLIKLRGNDENSPEVANSNKLHVMTGRKLDSCIANMKNIIAVKMRLSIFTESYAQLSLVCSSLLAAPRFFAGKITFGELMQVNSAFGNLYENLSWFINAYHTLADWKATTDRLIAFDRALASLSKTKCFPLIDGFTSIEPSHRNDAVMDRSL
ncbi:SbmA/BacA-like family transporter [Pseudomonas svalbardensis]|uniref:SbmA/BacA-like family transporter n=1 Tax=Pseudomonas svalbardensis TaxID=3042029 RepID=UPI0024B34555|nr:SbmA/BacA-like family transporter [Pseudomonas sp. PMCC200367]